MASRRTLSESVLPTIESLENRQFLSANFFTQHNLVSDGAVPADRIDKNLKNPWGLASDTPGPLWVANNGTNTATIYSFDTGKPAPLIVHIRGHGGTESEDPTGQVYNIAERGFNVHKHGKAGSAKFIFAGEDGTISAWSPGVDPNNTVLGVDNSSKGGELQGPRGGRVAGQVLPLRHRLREPPRGRVRRELPQGDAGRHVYRPVRPAELQPVRHPDDRRERRSPYAGQHRAPLALRQPRRTRDGVVGALQHGGSPMGSPRATPDPRRA